MTKKPDHCTRLAVFIGVRCGVAGSYIPGLSGLMVMQLAQAIIKSSSA